MFEITNAARPYAWGSTLALAELCGREPTGEPEAEIWFGDHPSGPATRVDDGRTLVEWESEDASRTPLPFLLKLLAVATPLSVQVHPGREAAAAGFAREESAGVPRDAPNRNYRDANHKPEMVRAVTEFSALCGFRPANERMDILVHLIGAGVPGAAELALACESGVRGGVEQIVRRAPFTVELATALAGPSVSTGLRHVDDAVRTAKVVATSFPGDPGVALTILLNHVVLAPGEALAVSAGTVHAYLSGVAVEVMACSDNVVRGGLTRKHIDADEFLAVADWSEATPERVSRVVEGAVARLPTDLPDVNLVDVAVNGPTELSTPTPAIALVLDGSVSFGSEAIGAVTPGRAVFLERADSSLVLDGEGTVVIASAN